MEKIWWWLKKAVYGMLAIKGGLKELLDRIRKVVWHRNEGRLPNPIQVRLSAYNDIINICAD